MSLKKIMVGDLIGGKITHLLFESGDTLVAPNGVPITLEGHTHSTIELAVTAIRYIDGNRQDTYFPDGSIIKPFKDIRTAIKIMKTYTTMEELLADVNPENINVGEFVIINGSPIEEDNGKIFTWNTTGYQYVKERIYIIAPGNYIIETDPSNPGNSILDVPNNTYLLGQGEVNIEPELNALLTIVSSTKDGCNFSSLNVKGAFVLNGNDTLEDVTCYNIVKNLPVNVTLKDCFIVPYDATLATITSNQGSIHIVNSHLFATGCKSAIDAKFSNIFIKDTDILSDGTGDVLHIEDGLLNIKGLSIDFKDICGVAVFLKSEGHDNYIEHLKTYGRVLLNCSPVYIESIKCPDVFGDRIRFRSSATIENDSTVFGKTVKNALNTLNNDKMSILYGRDGDKPTIAFNGQQYFNTTLDRPIFKDGNTWVDAFGHQVFPMFIDLN